MIQTHSSAGIAQNPLLCAVLSEKQKRQLAAEQFAEHNYLYRGICWNGIFMNYNNETGFGIFSDSRNYDDVYIKYDKLNERQIALLVSWGVSQHGT